MSLSEQQLIDCDRGGQDQGCNGGFEDYILQKMVVGTKST